MRTYQSISRERHVRLVRRLICHRFIFGSQLPMLYRNTSVTFRRRINLYIVWDQ